MRIFSPCAFVPNSTTVLIPFASTLLDDTTGTMGVRALLLLLAASDRPPLPGEIGPSSSPSTSPQLTGLEGAMLLAPHRTPEEAEADGPPLMLRKLDAKCGRRTKRLGQSRKGAYEERCDCHKTAARASECNFTSQLSHNSTRAKPVCELLHCRAFALVRGLLCSRSSATLQKLGLTLDMHSSSGQIELYWNTERNVVQRSGNASIIC
jgi:hypothetical protein